MTASSIAINEDNVKEASRLNSLGTQAHKDAIISLHAVATFSSKVVTEYLMKEYPSAHQVRYP
jgi:hypothetical protein